MNDIKIVNMDKLSKISLKNTDEKRNELYDIYSSTPKKININGVNNRYQIKKMTVQYEAKKSAESIKWKIPSEYLTHEKQIELVNIIYEEIDYFKSKKPDIDFTSDNNMEILYNYLNKVDHFDLIKNRIKTKITNYNYQDIIKKIQSPDLINFIETVELLNNSKLICHYCQNKLLLLYELVREMQQWTLDRIDNSIGHIKDNVVISCLDCNLKRRNINSNKFHITKNMKIVRNEYSDMDTVDDIVDDLENT
jgi:hypothetical protein